MILCRNGHENQDGATYCVVCKIYIDSTIEPPPPPIPPEPPRQLPPTIPLVRLTPDLLTVIPGGEGVSDLRIENVGTADEYSIEVEGPMASWASVVPAQLAAAAGASGAVRVIFRLPSAAATGTMPFEVTVVSRRDPDVRASAPGMLEISVPESPPPLSAGLEPTISRGRVSARCLVSVRNPASAPVHVKLSVSEAEGFLAFDIDPSEMRVDPGGTATADLRVRARRRLLVRGERPRLYQVLIVPEGGTAVSIDGTFVQKRYLPLVLVPVAGFMLITVTIATLIVLLIIVLVVYYWLV
jgi:hypothetical protein